MDAGAGWRCLSSPAAEARGSPHWLRRERDVCGVRIAAAARELVRLRDGWLNPHGLDPAEHSKRSLTNLYNARPTWLEHALASLDTTVLAAYGWPPDLSGEPLLAALLALNLERDPA